MLDAESHIVDLGASLVLRVDIPVRNHGTIMFRSYASQSRVFVTTIILSDAMKMKDTVTITVDDSKLGGKLRCNYSEEPGQLYG